jgi:hypothetical protein
MHLRSAKKMRKGLWSSQRTIEESSESEDGSPSSAHKRDTHQQQQQQQQQRTYQHAPVVPHCPKKLSFSHPRSRLKYLIKHPWKRSAKGTPFLFDCMYKGCPARVYVPPPLVESVFDIEMRAEHLKDHMKFGSERIDTEDALMDEYLKLCNDCIPFSYSFFGDSSLANIERGSL